MKWWKRVGILLLGVGIGIFLEHQFGVLHEMKFDYVRQSPGTTMGDQLASEATTEAVVRDAGLGDARRVSALSGPGTDEMAVQVSQTDVALLAALSVNTTRSMPRSLSSLQVVTLI